MSLRDFSVSSLGSPMMLRGGPQRRKTRMESRMARWELFRLMLLDSDGELQDGRSHNGEQGENTGAGGGYKCGAELHFGDK